MTLDKEDLRAIKALIDEAVEESDQGTAAGFFAVDEQFRQVWAEFDHIKDDISEAKAGINDLKGMVSRLERVQLTEMERNDHQDVSINKIRKHLHAV